MGVEIERKFLVKGDYKTLATKSYRITQGYLSSIAERTVRVRICDAKAFLTIKGKANKNGLTRFEWEKEIAIVDAQNLLLLCELGVIDKTRYIIPTSDNLIFEIDEFHGENEGLVVAEIELPTEEFPFMKPDWLGEEVSGDVKYYNSILSKNPFCKWN